VRFEIPAEKATRTTVSVYSITGKRVDLIADGFFDSGLHEVQWDASKYASGIYIIRLEIGTIVLVKQMS